MENLEIFIAYYYIYESACGYIYLKMFQKNLLR